MKQKNGNKFAFWIVGITLIACLVAVGSITAFYKLYDPEKYGRNHGGVDIENTDAEIHQNK